ncbi:MAG: bifunctional riboflavin kinase/FAD synthetase [Anaerolineae bacterium]|jgi:riboflavin kinase/FMN adenylyltransferase
MRVVHHLRDVKSAHGSSGKRHYVTIGVFDGLHQGHQRIIEGLVQDAHEADQVAVAITFDPHPATVLGGEALLLLTTVGERLDLMKSLELDIAVVFPFTEEVVHTTARDFVDELMRHLDLAEIRVGPDFTLGHQRKGDIAYLTRLGAKLGFTIRVTEPVMWRGAVVHSSRVRDALRSGDIEEANGCLGRPYRISGVVIHGRGLGQTIGVPTANLAPPPSRLIPGSGVYACLAETERWGTHPAAVNVGTRPTFMARSDSQGLTVEAHLLDFDRDLYDQVLALDFVARLRDERAYPTLNALVDQMRKDIAQTRARVGN